VRELQAWSIQAHRNKDKNEKKREEEEESERRWKRRKMAAL
jgi:hypothetical protein